MTTFESYSVSLDELMQDIRSGVIQLPDFQRGWIWDDDRIRDLLASVFRFFPIGSIMLLENGGSARFQSQPVEGLRKTVNKDTEPEKLILDGLQRLTTLTQVVVLNGPVQTRTASRRSIRRLYYIDIRTAVEDPRRIEAAIFGVNEKRKLPRIPGRQLKRDLTSIELECRSLCFPCNQAMQPDDWEAVFLKVNSGNPAAIALYRTFREKLIDPLRHYQVPVTLLKNDASKEDVCRTFERVNLNGAQLTVFELLNAKYIAADYSLRDDWYGSLEHDIPSRKDNVARNPLLEDIDVCEFIQAVALLHTHDLRKAGESKGKTGKQLRAISAKRNDVLDLPREAWVTWAARVETAYEQVAYFLRAEALYHRRELPYSTQLIPLVAVMARIGEQWRETPVRKKLAQWYWCGVLGELYDGDVESRIARDYEELLAWFVHDSRTPGTVREASFSPERFEFLHTRNSAAYKGVALLILREGAEDWYWLTSIRDLKIYEIAIDIYRVFPRAWCERQGVPRSQYDSILNKSLLSFKANRKIGRLPPSEYIAKLEADKQIGVTGAAMDAVLSSHSLSAEILRSDDFFSFIEDRRERLLELVSTAMGKAL